MVAPKSNPSEAKAPGENSEVASSNPAQWTNLPATYTPQWLAEDMVALASIGPHDTVLEPSAGYGAIVQAITRKPHGHVFAVELNNEAVKALRDLNVQVIHMDFLKSSADWKISRVVMNPPKNAFDHVIKASKTLVSGGRLVALLHRQSARPIADELCDCRLYHLPSATFKDRMSTILVWDKP